jgi:hypothetical protein
VAATGITPRKRPCAGWLLGEPAGVFLGTGGLPILWRLRNCPIYTISEPQNDVAGLWGQLPDRPVVGAAARVGCAV